MILKRADVVERLKAGAILCTPGECFLRSTPGYPDVSRATADWLIRTGKVVQLGNYEWKWKHDTETR